MRIVCVLLSLAALAVAKDDVKEKEPGPKSKGKVYSWKAKDGLVYRYYIPKRYDAGKGANLTMILHGSNLSAGWGFWNHKAGEFRPDDIVVSPDGTTSNGKGGFNFLGERKDAKRLKALQDELRKMFKVRATYLYGHSQGSFFALYYAGEFPEDVQGVVAHASGVWTWTQQSPKGHHQAIVLMHGTLDPVVPYVQSPGGYKSYRDAKYPMVRLRSLENWNHWPAEHNGPVPHTSQQLAWVEGMTTGDPERIEVCFDFLADCKTKTRTDFAAIYTLAKRILDTEGLARSDTAKRAGKAIEAIDALAAAHVKALSVVSPNDKPKAPPTKKGWFVHAQAFLRTFMDVPARDEFADQWEKVLEKHEKAAVKHFGKYWKAINQGKKADAFKAGTAVLKEAYLHVRAEDNEMIKNLKEWRKQAKQLKIPKKALKDYDAIAPDMYKALTTGYREFDSLNKKVGRF